MYYAGISSSFRSESYVTRTLLALVHVVYYVMLLSFYVTCFLSLVLDRSSLETTASLNSKNDTYYVILVLNCFKPLAWLLIIYYDTRYYHSNVDAIVSGAVLLCVFAASLALEVVMLYEYFFYCNASNTHYNNPCNDLLYCCYYPENPTCDGLWANINNKTCYYANLPQYIASNIRWRDTVDLSSINNTTLLSNTIFKLSPDREFVIALSVNTIIMIAEFWFFLVNMIRISDKIKEFTRDNDQQFEPLSENNVFGIPSPLLIVKRFFESVEKEKEKENENDSDKEKENDDNDDDDDEKRKPFGAKTSSSLSKKDELLQQRRKKHVKDVEYGAKSHPDDENIFLDELGNDVTNQKHGDYRFSSLFAWFKRKCSRNNNNNGVSSKGGNGCRRLCLFCRAKCDRSSFNMKSKCKAVLYWGLKSVQSVFIFVKDGVYHLFIIKQDEPIVNVDDRRRQRRPQHTKRNNNNNNNQGRGKPKPQSYGQRTPSIQQQQYAHHHHESYLTQADNTF